MSMFRELILGDSPIDGSVEGQSCFDGEENFPDCSEATALDALAFIEKAKNNDLYVDESCTYLDNELEEAWGVLNYSNAVADVQEDNSLYALSVKTDEIGYVFRIINEVGAKAWGVLKIN